MTSTRGAAASAAMESEVVEEMTLPAVGAADVSAAVLEPVELPAAAVAELAVGIDTVAGADFETMFPVKSGFELPQLGLALGWALEQLPTPVGLGLPSASPCVVVPGLPWESIVSSAGADKRIDGSRLRAATYGAALQLGQVITTPEQEGLTLPVAAGRKGGPRIFRWAPQVGSEADVPWAQAGDVVLRRVGADEHTVPAMADGLQLLEVTVNVSSDLVKDPETQRSRKDDDDDDDEEEDQAEKPHRDLRSGFQKPKRPEDLGDDVTIRVGIVCNPADIDLSMSRTYQMEGDLDAHVADPADALFDNSPGKISFAPIADGSFTFGAIVTGVDIGFPIPEESVQILMKAFHEHKLLLFRGQKNMTPRAELRLTSYMVDREEDPGLIDGTGGKGTDYEVGSIFDAMDEGFAIKSTNYHPLLAQGRNIRLVDHFGLTRNVETNGILGTEHWHTDGYTSPYPPCVTLMCCWQGPESGTDTRPSGPTKFCDGVNALRRLKETHPEMYEKALTLVQVFGGPQIHRRNARGTRALARQADPTDEYGNEYLPLDDINDMQGKMRKLTPLVRQHPITGELALHGSTQGFWKFVGVPEEESRELMEWFQDWTTSIQYPHRWLEGDAVLWDNRCLLHSAPPSGGPRDRSTPTDRRLHHRVRVVSLQGTYGPALPPNEQLSATMGRSFGDHIDPQKAQASKL